MAQIEPGATVKLVRKKCHGSLGELTERDFEGFWRVETITVGALGGSQTSLQLSRGPGFDWTIVVPRSLVELVEVKP